MRAEFVGRDAELRQLDAALARAEGGAGCIVLICGEAGVGKTRLCAELRLCCQRRGGTVLSGRAVPEEAYVPYTALADSLRGTRRTAPAVWDAARARAEVLWPVARELTSPGTGHDRPVDQAMLFEALLDVVEEAVGDQQAALWILDDVQWADRSVWDFVRYVARRIADVGMVLAVTYRDEELGPWHPQWPDLIRLKQEPVVFWLPLSRLATADSERLIRAIGPELPAGTVREIAARAAGTPLLIEELISLAAKPGCELMIPDVLRATVQERAERLSPQARELLEAAAAAGTDMDADLLRAVVPRAEVDDLVAIGLLERDDEGIRFRHPLFRQAVHAAVPHERMRSLHERIAEAMAAQTGHVAQELTLHDGGDSRLSPRELEIAMLIAQGLSNPAIARRLFLGRPTVATHVTHILAKLGFESRTQIAAWVGRREPQH
jgi:predicted ATPase/DNA-binding CsgD family transcriptional regulator